MPRKPVQPEALEGMKDQLAAGRRHANINDVARIAGVSKKTVSRVINNSELVREETRKHVNSVIEALGFAPDPQARALAMRRSLLIGMIYDNPNPQYVVEAQEGILQALEGTDYELAVHRCNPSAGSVKTEAKRFVERLRLSGVILTPSVSEADEIVATLREMECAYVRVAGVSLDTPERMVVSNDRFGGAEAARHLLSLGHGDRIAYISGKPGFRSSIERRAGFEDVLNEAGFHLSNDLVFEGDYTFDSGYAAAERLMSMQPRPTAVFAANDEMAAGALRAIRMRRLRVPEDISVVGYDDFGIAMAVWPRLTTIHSPTRDIGKMAATLLLDKINGKPVGDTALEMTPWLVMRDSTAPPSSA
jgi:LacI family transcriptional regulator